MDTQPEKSAKLTDVQFFLFTMPAIVTLTLALLILLDKRARQNPVAYISLFLSGTHLYHHYTLTRLQNKIKL
tara:strand:- start:2537 stop:2752 length:216 start_codon:yes stop_codon:yes gene_type:complete